MLVPGGSLVTIVGPSDNDGQSPVHLVIAASFVRGRPGAAGRRGRWPRARTAARCGPSSVPGRPTARSGAGPAAPPRLDATLRPLPPAGALAGAVPGGPGTAPRPRG